MIRRVIRNQQALAKVRLTRACRHLGQQFASWVHNQTFKPLSIPSITRET